MSRDLVRRLVVVHGFVQGVWFRASVREQARARGVSGWASNRPDGTVEVVLEGDPAAVARVVDYCRLGPPGARVDAVDVHEEPPEGISGFRIR
jgi:acylphosphatase